MRSLIGGCVLDRFVAARPFWREAQEGIVEDQPYTFLFIQDRLFGVSERVQGTVPDPLGFYRSLPAWWISESRQRHPNREG